MSPKTHEKLAHAARELARSAGYLGAGTVEFLVDAEENFYFLEMNTRLQVEHPITEWITGLDLVEWQIRVALGEPLPARQEEISLHGHAIEVRLYAEDPDNHFFPSPGKIVSLAWPSGPSIRVDTGVRVDCEVSVFYDPLVAKLSVVGRDREHAHARLRRALTETRIGGIKTNLAFLQRILLHPEHVRGNLSTTFIADHGPFTGAKVSEETLDAAIAGAYLAMETEGTSSRRAPAATTSNWWTSGLQGGSS